MRIFLIVLDGVGIGALPDAGSYGDVGSNTLLHVAESVSGLRLPRLESLGLGRIIAVPGVRPLQVPTGSFGRLAQRSAGKDSTTGHWELAGLVLERPFPTYPHGFPNDVLERIGKAAGYEWIGNVAASGTEIIERLGEQHQRTGKPIVYTSADSVFQIAAHEDTIPLDELYRICRVARQELGEHAVGRHREAASHRTRRSTTGIERLRCRRPPTLLDRLVGRRARVTVGGRPARGAGDARAPHADNTEGQEALLDLAKRSGRARVREPGGLRSLYGHRNDAAGSRGRSRCRRRSARSCPPARG
jgi:phosphopentomutase